MARPPMEQRLKPLVAGNWKMNGTRAALEVAVALAKGYDMPLRQKADVLVCPPATLLYLMSATLVGSGIGTGGQDCHVEEAGAFTGDISAAMLADAGASHVILGHSERRTLHGEKSALVCAKVRMALANCLVPVICIGETLAQRDAGKTLSVVREQLRGSLPRDIAGHAFIIAYEPLWAIGTGKTPTPSDIVTVHGAIRRDLARLIGKREAASVRILYGGSVKPSNAGELLCLPDVDGALVGGASLKANDFLGIVTAIG